MVILGISAFYHDSAASLIKDGEIIAAAQEERFSRIKHDKSFPKDAIKYCLNECGIEMSDVDYVSFYDKPFIKFERLLETYLSYAPKGFKSFIRAMPLWIKEKLFLKVTLRREIQKFDIRGSFPKLLFNEHHRSHAASAFFPSPFSNAAVLCIDGVGEWATTSAWIGEGNLLKPIWQISFPHSLGLLYSAFTYYCGFKVNSGEYKLMGLAPYGKPIYKDLILEKLIDVKNDGSFRLNMNYFNYAIGLTMTNRSFDKLFGGPPRKKESPISQREMDIAASIQKVTEEIVLKISKTLYEDTKIDNLCLAGGVALNCVSNGRLVREGSFKNIWIQPASGDAGGSLGAAYSAWYEYIKSPRQADNINDEMKGGYLGGSFDLKTIESFLEKSKANFNLYEDEVLLPKVAKLISEGRVVGWFNGRMEFGPRALGARSIIGDSRSKLMQSTMNLKIKYRESFRPFAPAVKNTSVSQWFKHAKESPYMLIVAEVNNDKLIDVSKHDNNLFGMEKLKVPRSTIPAVTHVDNTARIQTVNKETNPRFYKLIDSFEAITGCPVLINTSFNVRGEPIVYSPEDAYKCFMRTEMDVLILENFMLIKDDQPDFEVDESWKMEFELD